MRDLVSEVDYFEQQIRDIDKDLCFTENSNIPMPAVDSCTKNSVQAMMDLEEKTHKKQSKQPRALSQVHPLPFTNISNLSNHANAAARNPHPTWKRMACSPVSSQNMVEDSIGIKRPVDMVIDHYELPCKKLVVSSNDKENYPSMAETGFQSHQSQ